MLNQLTSHRLGMYLTDNHSRHIKERPSFENVAKAATNLLNETVTEGNIRGLAKALDVSWTVYDRKKTTKEYLAVVLCKFIVEDLAPQLGMKSNDLPPEIRAAVEDYYANREMVPTSNGEHLA